MMSVDQTYSRLFRPWDISDTKNDKQITSDIKPEKHFELKTNKRTTDEVKRENRLRKIRGILKKTERNLHQDATISTTTGDAEDYEKTKIPPENIEEVVQSPVASLSMCCDRLLEEPEKKKPSNESRSESSTTAKPADIPYSPTMLPPSMMPSSNMYNGYLPDYLPVTDIAQTLGIPPTDPLLLESLAQGYAMELEYARIIQQENEAKLLQSRKQRPKKYKCPHCQVGFSNNGQLKGHVRIHTGERPFKCDEKNCGKTFTRNEELTRHKRIHSGVRPFPCTTCGKKFGRRDHLKKHTRTHFMQAERMMPVFVPLSAVPHVGGFPYLYGY